MIISMFITVLVILLVVDFLFRKSANEKATGIPAVPYYPFIGSWYLFSLTSFETVVNLMNYGISLYGKIFRIWLLNDMIITVTDPKVVGAVLGSVKHIRKPRYYDVLQPWLGDSALVSLGKRWSGQRKLIGMGLHFSAYPDYLQIIDEKARILVIRLKEQCDAGPFDVTEYIVAATLDTITEIGMGVSMNTQRTESEYASALHRVIESISDRLVKPFLLPELCFRLFAPRMRKRQNECIKTTQKISEDIIDKRKTILQEFTKTNEDNSASDSIGIQRRANFLDTLLQATLDGQPLSRNELREQVDAFMFGGHDTSATCLIYTLYCLSRHREAQDKAFDEIRRVMGDDPTTPEGLKELNELKYMELVLKETLRLYPVAPMIGRRIEEDIPIDNITLPAHSTIAIPIYIIHKDPDVFLNPEKFIPERFAPETGLEKRHPFSFLGFSAGPRDCRGQKFAMLEMKCFMSKILRNFELLPMGEEPQIKLNAVIKSMNGIQLGLKSRVYG